MRNTSSSSTECVRRQRPTPNRLATGFCVPLCCIWLGVCGCHGVSRWLSNGWVMDYDTAEQSAIDKGKPLVIFFESAHLDRNESANDVLKEADVEAKLRGYVRCRLNETFEPDRRFVGQYDLQRAPALVVVRADGTYHAIEPALTKPAIRSFFDRIDMPGKVPAHEDMIPRRVTYEWLSDVDAALATARAEQRPLMIVLYRTFREDWMHLGDILYQDSVHLAGEGWLFARQQTLLGMGGADALADQFGVSQMPALVFVYPDGRQEIIEAPTREATLEIVRKLRGADDLRAQHASAR